jgi:hypothetical protein
LITRDQPELVTSPTLTAEQANYYMSLIGILGCAVELGQLDIYIDMPLLSSFTVQPRIGHMEEVLHIFSYLKCHLQSNIVFDPNEINWDEDQFRKYYWKDFYHEATKAMPPHSPIPRGNSAQMNVFYDPHHAGNKLMRHLHTCILMHLNSATIQWYSKAQKTVESSTFGSEFIAMRICVDMIKAIRYKLRMFGKSRFYPNLD